jgi:hypothetical protein
MFEGIEVSRLGIHRQDPQASADHLRVRTLPEFFVGEILGGEKGDVGAKWTTLEHVSPSETLLQLDPGQFNVEGRVVCGKAEHLPNGAEEPVYRIVSMFSSVRPAHLHRPGEVLEAIPAIDSVLLEVHPAQSAGEGFGIGRVQRALPLRVLQKCGDVIEARALPFVLPDESGEPFSICRALLAGEEGGFGPHRRNRGYPAEQEIEAAEKATR